MRRLSIILVGICGLFVGCSPDSRSTSESVVVGSTAAATATEASPAAAPTQVAATTTAPDSVTGPPEVTGPVASRSVQPVDHPCVAVNEAGLIDPIGITLEELAAMVLPAEALIELAGDGSWTAEAMFVPNDFAGLAHSRLPAAACNDVEQFGRVIGMGRLIAEEGTFSQLQTNVEVFRDEAGATDYVAWFPYTQSEGEPRVQYLLGSADEKPIDGLGTNAKYVVSDDVGYEEGSQIEAVVAQRGNLVVTVELWSRALRTGSAVVRLPIDLAAIATDAMYQVGRVQPTGEPYDLAELMSAPLPAAAFGPQYADYGMSYHFKVSACLPGSREAEQEVGHFGRGQCRTEYTPGLNLPADRGPFCETAVTGGVRVYSLRSAVIPYPSPDEARRALRETLRFDNRALTPGDEFEVTDPVNALGRRASSEGNLVEEFIAFTHGPFLATVGIMYNPVCAPDTHREILDAARSLDERLAVIFG